MIKNKKKSGFKKVFVWLIALSLLAGAGKMGMDYHNQTEGGTVNVHSGATLQEITVILESYGIIRNAHVFYYYMLAQSEWEKRKTGIGIEYNFEHGTYQLAESDLRGLIQQLTKGPAERGPAFSVTIPEGYTIAKMAALFEKEKLFSQEAFLKHVQDKKIYKKYRKQYSWLPPYNEEKPYPLEGYLKADTYYLDANLTVEKMVGKMLKETDGVYERNQEFLEGLGLTFDELLTLASVVEAESKNLEDRAKVAQVFYNRLEAGMKLQSDMTAAYANQEHKLMMTYKDISVKSPYNTYHTEGLPIGPINSPSKESLRGAFIPEGKAFKAVYFYARPSGETYYATTFEGHQENINKYRHEWETLNQK